MKPRVSFALVFVAAALAGGAALGQPYNPVLKPEAFKHYIDQFNADDEELYPQYIPNAKTWEFLKNNIPLFECPDKDIERTYYFRWWTYRKHIKQTPDGFIITEFLPPVGWAGKHNSINCAAGHHFYEGRWLHDPQYLNDYATFWFRKGGDARRYSFWAADALWARYIVNGDSNFVIDLLPDLIKNYEAWEKDHQDSDGLFWQIDGNDGMEVSIGGSGKRATINSYMYGDAAAISRLAELAGDKETAKRFWDKAVKIRELVQTKLWDKEAQFFKTLPRDKQSLVDVRELHGYTPWYFNLPGAGYGQAWKQLTDPNGFYAPFGPTTAEQRHPKFAISYEGHECQWNGPSWPYSTSVTLTAMANLLSYSPHDVVTSADYFNLLKIYTKCHQLTREDGRAVPWIDENLNPRTGDWLSRTRLKSWKDGTWDPGKGGKERGKDYNHSTYCDLIITGLMGVRPMSDEAIRVCPLLPPDTWDWFCLDNVLYRGRIMTILWDKTGQQYGRGKGLRVFADGRLLARSDSLKPMTPILSPGGTSGGWRKHSANPVLGGNLGTCFDVSLLREDKTYRMWFSWRPKKSVALVESPDGIQWTEPAIVLGPNQATDWESDINRPVVVKRGGAYHMWYTGQARGHSWIGYATSPDGVQWKRMSEKPVLSPDQPWEDVAIMCPHVLWDEKQQTYRMWYSAGQQYEPNAIGYATSPDGVNWTKPKDNPIFTADPANPWERHKVTACQIIPMDGEYIMFYIGFANENRAAIGLARSPDGITGWQRHPDNPIIFPTQGAWDGDACYKPFALYDKERHWWMLWYNGRKGNIEQIGMAIYPEYDLWSSAR